VEITTRRARIEIGPIHQQDSSGSQTKALPLPTFREDAGGGSFLAVHDGSSLATNSLQLATPCRPQAARTTASTARIKPISLVFTVSRNESSGDQETGGQISDSPVKAQKQEQEMQDEVDALENRNTPVIGTGGVGAGRVGDPGFDQLIIADTLLGTAYTASDRVRFGVEGHGVYASAGSPNGSSSLRFGTLAAKTAFGAQSSVGYSGIAELSTKTFGLEVGSSPHGFPVHNLIGGIRFRPHNRWLTLLGVRGNVKDSLLSYTGAHDPVTGIRWGGVVSNTATSRFDSAPSSNLFYKTIGEYASVSFSFYPGTART
jgi:hypothetical protein